MIIPAYEYTTLIRKDPYEVTVPIDLSEVKTTVVLNEHIFVPASVLAIVFNSISSLVLFLIIKADNQITSNTTGWPQKKYNRKVPII